jgi:hypothetical protein
MSRFNFGPWAFPRQIDRDEGGGFVLHVELGMTLWDYYFAHAVSDTAGRINPARMEEGVPIAVGIAATVADAMMLERKKREDAR